MARPKLKITTRINFNYMLNSKENIVRLITIVETRLEKVRSCLRCIYNFRPETEPSAAASESANQEVGGGSRRAHEIQLRRRCGRIRRNEKSSHENRIKLFSIVFNLLKCCITFFPPYTYIY